MTCVPAHALLSALIRRLETGGHDADADELRAIVAAGCPRTDLESALSRANGEASARARALLARIETPERASKRK